MDYVAAACVVKIIKVVPGTNTAMLKARKIHLTLLACWIMEDYWR